MDRSWSPTRHQAAIVGHRRAGRGSTRRVTERSLAREDASGGRVVGNGTPGASTRSTGPSDVLHAPGRSSAERRRTRKRRTCAAGRRPDRAPARRSSRMALRPNEFAPTDGSACGSGFAYARPAPANSANCLQGQLFDRVTEEPGTALPVGCARTAPNVNPRRVGRRRVPVAGPTRDIQPCADAHRHEPQDAQHNTHGRQAHRGDRAADRRNNPTHEDHRNNDPSLADDPGVQDVARAGSSLCRERSISLSLRFSYSESAIWSSLPAGTDLSLCVDPVPGRHHAVARSGAHRIVDG